MCEHKTKHTEVIDKFTGGMNDMGDDTTEEYICTYCADCGIKLNEVALTWRDYKKKR